MIGRQNIDQQNLYPEGYTFYIDQHGLKVNPQQLQQNKQRGKANLGRFDPRFPTEDEERNDNDIAFNYIEDYISRKHAQIYFIENEKEQSFYIKDRGSLHGTSIRVFQNNPVVLQQGLVIELAETVQIIITSCVVEPSINLQQIQYPQNFIKIFETSTLLQNQANKQQNLKVLQHGAGYKASEESNVNIEALNVIHQTKNYKNFQQIKEPQNIDQNSGFETTKNFQNILRNIKEENQQQTGDYSKYQQKNQPQQIINQPQTEFTKDLSSLAKQSAFKQDSQVSAQKPIPNSNILQQQNPQLTFKWRFKQLQDAKENTETISSNAGQKFVYKIGSGAQQPCNLPVQFNNSISRFHCRIVYDTQYGWLLYDGSSVEDGYQQNGSSLNGTFVNLNDINSLQDKRDSLGYKITDGLTFSLGGYWFNCILH